MDLKDEFYLGRDWIFNNLNFSAARRGVSVFETTIRELGGLLSAYEFSKDKIFLDKAEELAALLLPAFNTEFGLPLTTIELATGRASTPSWTQGSAILSEIGTLQLEFLYLAYHTKNNTYAKLVRYFQVFADWSKKLDPVFQLLLIYCLYFFISL
jgi:uncharacterized protein YyaL (SSP411 family)